jgi:hypothetical protein
MRALIRRGGAQIIGGEGSCCGSDDRYTDFSGIAWLGWLEVDAMHVLLLCVWR